MTDVPDRPGRPKVIWHRFWIWFHERQARKWKREWYWHQVQAWEHDYVLNPRTDADMRREVGVLDD